MTNRFLCGLAIQLGAVVNYREIPGLQGTVRDVGIVGVAGSDILNFILDVLLSNGAIRNFQLDALVVRKLKFRRQGKHRGKCQGYVRVM